MIKFGTGGWRAIIADQFTFENVRRVAKGLSILIKNNRETVKPVVIGHDLRFLSGRFSRAFAEVLVVENIPVLFIENAIPTPMLMYAVEQEELNFGIMITASHNTPEYNEPFYEVPVGFKYISMKMEEQDLLLGGESSGGLKIRGHVNVKDGILAAILSVEMFAKTNKSIRELLKEIDYRYGKRLFQSLNLPYHSTERSRLQHILFKEKYIPKFSKEIKDILYIDGVKCYFKNGTWLSIRFSGTEPVLRIFMEMNDQIEVKDSIDTILNDKRLSLNEII